ncbi:MAG: DUF3108 domain-containing protein [Lewinellaceae bacterium]|nr:DUF3108 domain-containing protein [Lewinellaceae bacterium]
MKKKKWSKWIWAAASLPLLFGFVPLSFQAEGQTETKAPSKIDACTIDNNAFQHGEELTYKVYYNLNFIWVPAGEVVFNVNEVNGQFHYSVKGWTYSSYEWFFKVRDNYDTYVDKNTLLPTLSIRDVREGGYTLYDKVDFDQKRNTAFSTRGRSKENIKEQKEFPIDPCMHDMLSLIYYTRNLKFDQMKSGDHVPVKIFLDKEIYPLQMTFNGHVAKKSIKGLGKYDTLEFSPELIEGEYFKKGATMRIWATNDENKVPLLIESPVAVGSIKAVLKSYKRVRHEWSAEVDD